jgi:hypothetical protein
MTLPSEYVYTGSGVLVVARTPGAAVVLMACGVDWRPGTVVAGTAVVDSAWVTGCAGADEVHPAKSVASNSSPHTIPIVIIWLVLNDFFMVDRSIAYNVIGNI